MITRSVKLQLLVFAVIALAGMAFAGLRYANLDRFFTDTGYVVGADFSDSGGIFKGAEVTYRGVPVGAVEQLKLIPDGVRVELRLNPGSQVPADTKAAVLNRSAVGEQYVNLLPQREGGPYLHAGSIIPMSATKIPVQPAELLTNLDRFVNSINTDDVAIVLDELGQAFDNNAGQNLQRLVDAGNQLTQAATEALPQTIQLIRDGNTVLDTQRQTAGDFRSFNRDLRKVTATLRSSDPDFRRLYTNGTQSARQLQDLLQANRTALPVLLDNLISTAQVQQVRIPALRAILVTYPNVVAGGFTVAPGDGTAHFGLVNDSQTPVCTAGYSTTDQRLPQDTTLRTPNLAAYCAESGDSSGADIRGARNAPRPPGTKPFPENGGFASDKAIPPSKAKAAPASTGRTTAAPASGPGDAVVLGDYDPRTGKAITADGKTYVLGSNGGPARMLGGRSWEWLLLGPLASS